MACRARYVGKLPVGRFECTEVDALMEIIYLLIPVSLILLGLIVWILLWAVRDGQYDDLEGPAHQILMDEDRIVDRQKK
jgi:cbb3-type cytochrome oxidase maturation protein